MCPCGGLYSTIVDLSYMILYVARVEALINIIGLTYAFKCFILDIMRSRGLILLM